MSSWYSQLLTTTSSRITTLQRTLLAGESDGDTEDDTHVCRVLRAYYTEKGRPFPGWLPPDPKAPPPVQPVFAQQSQVGARYGGLTTTANSASAPGGLSSLWDNNPVNQRQDQASLRQGRGMPPQQTAAAAASSRNPFMGGRNSAPAEEVQARPLPSQRAGSYQQTNMNMYGRNSGSDGVTPPGSSAGGSAQDRLKQRLWGGARTASPAASAPFQPPAQQQPQGGSRYGGGGGDYEERFAPGGMYDSGGSGGGGSGVGRPFMASNAPWASNESEYMGGGGGGGGGRSGGLPGGPRRGLPSGPRLR